MKSIRRKYKINNLNNYEIRMVFLCEAQSLESIKIKKICSHKNLNLLHIKENFIKKDEWLGNNISTIFKRKNITIQNRLHSKSDIVNSFSLGSNYKSLGREDTLCPFSMTILSLDLYKQRCVKIIFRICELLCGQKHYQH